MYLHYRTLFSLRVLLDYYLTEEAGLYQASMSNVLDTQYRKYRLERDLRIVPTAECGQLFRDQKLLFKRNNMGGVVACQARPLPGGFFTPFIPLDAPLRLRFAVFPENPAFYNFTNIPLEKNGTGKDSFLYYFSNRSNNAVNSQLYLSRPVAPFDPAYAYKAGEILLNNSNPLSPVMQEALEDNGPGAQNLSQWREIFAGQNPHFQFVTTNDRVVVRPSAFKYRVESAAQEHLLVAVRNPNGVIVKTLAFHTDLPGAPLFECELKLNDLNPGLYRLEVQDTTGTVFPNLSLVFYLDDALYQQRPLAVIECFHEPSGSLSDYRWLDPDRRAHV